MGQGQRNTGALGKARGSRRTAPPPRITYDGPAPSLSPPVRDRRYPVLPLRLRLKRPDWKKPKWRNIAAQVAERDSHTCQMCGWVNPFPYPSSANRNLLLDHIIPLCRGGMNEVSNFQLLCEPCNRRKAHWLPWEL